MSSILFLFSCEGNNWVDKLANLALIHIGQYKWFNALHSCIYLDFVHIAVIFIMCLVWSPIFLNSFILFF